jgi:hypothetical protein
MGRPVTAYGQAEAAPALVALTDEQRQPISRVLLDLGQAGRGVVVSTGNINRDRAITPQSGTAPAVSSNRWAGRPKTSRRICRESPASTPSYGGI